MMVIELGQEDIACSISEIVQGRLSGVRAVKVMMLDCLTIDIYQLSSRVAFCRALLKESFICSKLPNMKLFSILVESAPRAGAPTCFPWEQL